MAKTNVSNPDLLTGTQSPNADSVKNPSTADAVPLPLGKGGKAGGTDLNPDLEPANPDLVSDNMLDAGDRFGIPDSEQESVSEAKADNKAVVSKNDNITVCIPARPDADNSDFVCSINGKKYRIPIGVEVTIPRYVWEFYLNYCSDTLRNGSKKKAMSDSAKDI